MKFLILIFLIAASCSHVSKLKTPAETQAARSAWMVQSDLIAEQFSKSLAELKPEIGSDIGYTEFDSKALLLDSEFKKKSRDLLAMWEQKLNAEIIQTTDINLKTDYQVLRNWLATQVSNIDAYNNAGEIEFSQGLKEIYQSFQTLVNPQSSLERKKAAVDRFKIYVNGDANHPGFLIALQEIFRADLIRLKGKSQLKPYIGEVENYLKDSGAYLNGIEELLKQTTRDDWQTDWVLFKNQSIAYEQFIRNEVLPNTRKNPSLPKAIYAQVLKQKGIDSSPDQLIQQGLKDYKNLSQKFRAQAKVVAKKYKLNMTDPASVIQYLKSTTSAKPQDLEALYKNSNTRLEEMIRAHNLVSLPAIPLKIRLAGEAESRSIPVPHLTQPPFVNNQGERPEFVVPDPSVVPFDDFSSIYAAMALTAHEGRPGHDLQFSSILDNGSTLIRGMYAANSVNIEGWALYAEDLVYDYFNDEEKLFALQSRLWRVARMYLDPQLQLAQIKDQRVIDVFTKELGVSKVMAQLELNRYKFRDIGQAPSYYEGYLIVKKMRDENQKKLGHRFNLKCFNDKLLSYGLLPLKISAERMRNESACDVK